jgi:lysophospholipase L1-like esterase
MTRVACLGDSIFEGSPYWDARRRTGEERGQWQWWAARVHTELRFANHGIWGERTDEILARFEEAATDADVLLVQGGINDIAQGRDVEAAAANLGAMIGRARERGLPVAVADVLPWNNAAPAQRDAIVRLNALIAQLGVPVLPFHDTLADPEDPERMRPEWTNEDGDHPSIDGYRRLGELAFRLP